MRLSHLKSLKHKASWYIEPDMLSFSSPNPIREARPDLQLWLGERVVHKTLRFNYDIFYLANEIPFSCLPSSKLQKDQNS